ncbi:MAG: hypothetical protein HC897_19385 [Thermoanaerobaculia bacterium]|nr:hypothetical protein [Thermoanaerobaculia bacterium]
MSSSVRDERFRNERFEAALAILTHLLDHPTAELPGVHCLNRATLHRLLHEVRAELQARGLGILRTNRPLVEGLENAGLLKRLSIQPATTRTPPIFAFDSRGESSLEVHPIEILQALEPRGVICYFTALELHGLTVQPTPHHHIATLKIHRPASSTTGTSKGGSHRAYDPLGTAILTYQGLPYYRTSRSSDLLVGYQLRYLDPRNLARVTTLEQTLVDTLHRPISCGGPEVVFEGWRNALDRLDDELLAALLERIGREDLSRKVGWMLETLERPTQGRLTDHLDQTRTEVDRSRVDTAPPLLQGFGNHRLDSRWMLRVP